MDFLKRLFGKEDKDTEQTRKQPATRKKVTKTYSSANIDLERPKTERQSSDNPALTETDLEYLAVLLEKQFNLAELRSLCVELHIDFESLAGDTKRAKVFSLIHHFNMPSRSIIQLVAIITKLRPNIDWQDASTKPIPQNQDLYQLVNYCFNKNELMDLCLKLGVKYEDLAGSDSRKAAELVSYMYRRNRVEELLAVCDSLRPKAPWYSKDKSYGPYSVGQLDALQQLLFDSFEEIAIRQLCTALDIDYRRLPEWEYGGTAREMVFYLARRERLDELVALCAEQKTEIPWADVLAKPKSQTKEPKSTEESSVGPHTLPERSISIQNDPKSLRQALSSMDESLFRTLCFDMGVDYENLPSRNRRVGLMRLMLRQKKIPELIQAIEFLMSGSE